MYVVNDGYAWLMNAILQEFHNVQAPECGDTSLCWKTKSSESVCNCGKTQYAKHIIEIATFTKAEVRCEERA